MYASKFSEQRKRRSHLASYVLAYLGLLSVLAVVLVPIAGESLAQETTPMPVQESDTLTGTPEPTTVPISAEDLTATQLSIETTQTQSVVDMAATNAVVETQSARDANATATVQVATEYAIATQEVNNAIATLTVQATQAAPLTPKPSATFLPLSLLLIVEPRSSTGTYSPGEELKFTVLVWSGLGAETRPLEVVLSFDTAAFAGPAEGSISEGGQAGDGSISWKMENILRTDEDGAKEFTFKTTIRPDITESVDGAVQAVVRNRGGVVLASTDTTKIPIVVKTSAGTPAAVASSQVPQGEGLFHDATSFAVLTGMFFGLGLLAIFLLGALAIYLTQDDEAREIAFTGTTEIFLLLIVLFSVIIMGVQNAIDRESINAIIGGIVGYVAGRAKSRISFSRDSSRVAPRSRETSRESDEEHAPEDAQPKPADPGGSETP